jgi:hypothetical protein
MRRDMRLSHNNNNDQYVARTQKCSHDKPSRREKETLTARRCRASGRLVSPNVAIRDVTFCGQLVRGDLDVARAHNDQIPHSREIP